MSDDRPDALACALERALEKPSLASLRVVNDLIRSVFAAAIVRRGEYFAGRAPDAAAQDLADLRRLAGLLQGEGAEDYSLQPWNSVGQMGHHVKEAYGLQSGEDEAVFTMLLSVLGSVYRRIDEAAARDADPSRESIYDLIDRLSAAVLGLSWQNSSRPLAQS